MKTDLKQHHLINQNLKNHLQKQVCSYHVMWPVFFNAVQFAMTNCLLTCYSESTHARPKSNGLEIMLLRAQGLT